MYMECEEYFDYDVRARFKDCELKAEKYEIEDAIIEQLFKDETYPSGMQFTFEDEVTGYNIIINGDDFIDSEMVMMYLDSLEEEDVISIDELYARAGVTNPKTRGKK